MLTIHITYIFRELLMKKKICIRNGLMVWEPMNYQHISKDILRDLVMAKRTLILIYTMMVIRMDTMKPKMSIITDLFGV